MAATARFSETPLMMLFYWLVCALVLPLQVLDARIERYHLQLAQPNLTTVDRLMLVDQMKRDMKMRYSILEEVPNEPNPF